MKRSLFGAVAALSLFAAGSAMAEKAAEKKSAKDVYVGGDAKAGEDVMLGECSGCHGETGAKTQDSNTPTLAGQNARYIYTQLKAFKAGTRKNAAMVAPSTKITDQQARDVSAFLATQAAATGVAAKDVADLGQQIYFSGNPATRVPACSACHGPKGRGNPAAAYPAVAGQHEAYLTAQLEQYKDGSRYTKAGDDLAKDVPAAHVMADVAANMTAAEIRAVSSYMNGLYSK